MRRRQHARDPHDRPRPRVPGREGDADRPRHRRDADHPRPGGFRGGRVSDELVSQIDLFPTICELAGIERPAWVRGRSLLDAERQRRGVCGDHVPRRVRAAARGAHEAIQVHPPLRQRPRGPVLANIDDSPSKDYLLAHGLAEQRACRRRSSTTSCSTRARRNNLAGDPAHAAVLAELRERLRALDARRPTTRCCTGRSSRRAGRRAQPARPSARPTIRRWCSGDRPRPADPGRRARRAARRTGPRGAGSRSRRSASTATRRWPDPRAYDFVGRARLERERRRRRAGVGGARDRVAARRRRRGRADARHLLRRAGAGRRAGRLRAQARHGPRSAG